jgi:hypothetical protein
MTPDEDFAAALPPAPPPRSDRREAAIEAAMRRFDGVDAIPSREDSEGREQRRWGRIDRPGVGVLVATALVVTIGLPVWIVSDHGPPATVAEQSVDLRVKPDARASGAEPSPEVAKTVAPPRAARVLPPASADPAHGAVAPETDEATKAQVEVASVMAEPRSERAFALAPPPPPPVAAVPAPAPPPPPPESDIDSAHVVVTGTRLRRDQSEAATDSPHAAFRLKPGAHPTTCTVDDPDRDLGRCRGTINGQGPAASAVRDGLAAAWQGKDNQALAAFDRAIEAAPRSAFLYYNRSLLLDRRGDARRAAADRGRALALDPGYREEIK